MISAWWLIPAIVLPGAVALWIAGVLAQHCEPDDVANAYDEGYRKGRESVHDEYEKRRAMTDKLYRRVMRIYNGEIERARLEVKHLRVIAGLEQEGME